MSKKFDKEWWANFRREAAEGVLELMAKKNNDYTGGKSTDNPFANFDSTTDFGIDPILGLNLRMGDKFARLKAFSKDGKLAVGSKGDSVEDIYRDLIGYSLLALGMLERAKSENEEEQEYDPQHWEKPCPEECCEGTLELDLGEPQSYDHPGQSPALVCDECGLDWDSDIAVEVIPRTVEDVEQDIANANETWKEFC